MNQVAPAVISYSGTPFCSATGSAPVLLSGPAAGVFSAFPSSVSINSVTGAINLSASTPGIYTITYTVPVVGVCASYTTSALVNIKPNSWTGTLSSDWSNPGNWAGGALPTASCPDINIRASAPHQPILVSGTLSVQNLLIEAGASLTLNDCKLRVSGNISNAGIIYASQATVEMSGTGAQTIPANCFANNAVKKLIISNSNSAGVSLGGPLDIYGSLSFSATGLSFNTNDLLTLKSTAAGSASVGDLTGKTIIGKVTVENYLSPRKSWRLLSVPTNSNQTISQAWQEGCGANLNCVPGYGVQLTGPGGIAGGYDVMTSTPSIKTYLSSTGSWTSVGAINTGSIRNKDAYMIFVRGDRSVTTATGIPTPTVLRTRGTLLAGDQAAVSVTASKFAAIGNPYASSLDAAKISKTGIKDFFYLWDPQLAGIYGYGAYQTFSADGYGGYDITPGGGSITTASIQSGQAFIVQASSTGGAIQFKEGAKILDETAAAIPPPSLRAKLRLRLYGILADGSDYLADGTLVNFDDSFSNVTDENDALKIANTSENLSILSSNDLLVVESRHTVGDVDTILLHLANVKQQSYRFEITPFSLYRPGLTAFLLDNYLHSLTPIDLESSNSISFIINNIPGTYAADRFAIILRQAVVLPVTFTRIQANRQPDKILVQWEVENELNMDRYEVQRSAGDNRFTGIGRLPAIANNGGKASYRLQDIRPLPGVSLYRIQGIEKDGKLSYSSTVKVQDAGAGNPEISLNQSSLDASDVRLHFIQQPQGSYEVRLVNQAGQVLEAQQLKINTGNTTEAFRLSSKPSKGIYFLQVSRGENIIKTFKITF